MLASIVNAKNELKQIGIIGITWWAPDITFTKLLDVFFMTFKKESESNSYGDVCVCVSYQKQAFSTLLACKFWNPCWAPVDKMIVHYKQ